MLEIVLKMVISPAAEHSLEENATNEQTVATTKQIQKKNFGFLFPFFFLYFFFKSEHWVCWVCISPLHRWGNWDSEILESPVIWRPGVLPPHQCFFEVWSWDQHHQRHLPRNWWEMQILSSTPGPLNQKLWCWGPAFQILTSPPGVSDDAKD